MQLHSLIPLFLPFNQEKPQQPQLTFPAPHRLSYSDVWASPWLHFCFGLCGVNNAPTAVELEEHMQEGQERMGAKSWIHHMPDEQWQIEAAAEEAASPGQGGGTRSICRSIWSTWSSWEVGRIILISRSTSGSRVLSSKANERPWSQGARKEPEDWDLTRLFCRLVHFSEWQLLLLLLMLLQFSCRFRNFSCK
ncbi:hypothetical protein M5D96_007657 [Drosophila gunungcola]|uniref:Uncharacterized protein n=1 Tax=Drosophila gunungcola TaxID=103775 RepID=A0A9P9YL07_9MUSC|nr:hypothetical protein M5D96_007657 [Drosophila gunungcola]